MDPPGGGHEIDKRTTERRHGLGMQKAVSFWMLHPGPRFLRRFQSTAAAG